LTALSFQDRARRFYDSCLPVAMPATLATAYAASHLTVTSKGRRTIKRTSLVVSLKQPDVVSRPARVRPKSNCSATGEQTRMGVRWH